MSDITQQDIDNGKRYHFWVILATIVLSTLVSLIWIIHDGINYQESYNLHLSILNNAGNIFRFGSNDDPMPLYFLILHWYNGIFNKPSIYLDRILSLICYDLLIIVAYLIGRIASGRSFTGLVSALLIAFSPFMIWYGNRATVYSMLALVVALNQLCFIGIYHLKKWGLPGYLITCFIGLALHFLFLAIIIPQILFLIVTRSKLKTPVFISALGSAIVSIGAFSIWVYYSLGHSEFWQYLPVTSKPSATNTFIIYFQYLFGFQSVTVTTLIISLWPILVILALLAVQKYIRPSESIKYLFVSAVLPILVLFLLSWVWRPLFLSSYLIICLPPFLICIAWYLSSFKQSALTIARYSLMVGMLIMMIFEITNWHKALNQDYLGSIQSKTKHISPVALLIKKI